jgi:hypothetical protein
LSPSWRRACSSFSRLCGGGPRDVDQWCWRMSGAYEQRRFLGKYDLIIAHGQFMILLLHSCLGQSIRLPCLLVGGYLGCCCDRLPYAQIECLVQWFMEALDMLAKSLMRLSFDISGLELMFIHFSNRSDRSARGTHVQSGPCLNPSTRPLRL